MFLEFLKHFINKTKVFFIILIIIAFVSCQTPVADKKDENNNAQEPIADFKITFSAADRMNGRLSPEEATGESATLTMVTGSSGDVDYNRYRIDFTGDIASLPDTVSVTITWDNTDATIFRWGGTGCLENGYITVNVPKDGGTVGISGSVYDTLGSFRPGLESLTGTAGTVKFEANLVHTLTCTIVRE